MASDTCDATTAFVKKFIFKYLALSVKCIQLLNIGKSVLAAWQE